MKKILLSLSLAVWLGACASNEIETKEAGPLAALNPNVEHSELVNQEDFKKCLDEYGEIKGNVSTKFYKNVISEYFHGGFYFFANWPYSNIFNNDNKNIKFDESNKCDQIKFTFSGKTNPNKHLIMAIHENEIIDSLSKNGTKKINKIAYAYFSSPTEHLPDNLARLPNHNFEITINCPTDIDVFCEFIEGKCDYSRGIDIKFPDQACTIKGIDQVFALYPKGQIRINFEGTIRKTGNVNEQQEEIEIKFNGVEWKSF